LEVLTHQNIIWLKVSVENALLMEVVHSFDDVKHYLLDLKDRDLSVAIFDEGVLLLVISCDVLEKYKILVIHASQNANLPDRGGWNTLFFVVEFELFDSDYGLLLDVVTFVDSAIGPFSELFYDFVSPRAQGFVS
jgi:hypothetical protein